MSYWKKRTEQKRYIVDLPILYDIIRQFEGTFYTVHLLPRPKKYIFYLYDSDLKYLCECHDITNYDIRMLRKLFINLYQYSDEVNEISKIFGTPK